jgi:hypothetical protein
MHPMRTTLVALVASLTLVVSGTLGVAASSNGAHFFSDTAASVNGSSQLAIHIDEGGLGQADVAYGISGTGTASYECINGGSNHPKASNKETVHSTINLTLPPISPVGGRIQTDITVNGTPPGPGSFSCPSGQSLVLASVSYSVTLTDTTNGVSIRLTASS